MSDMFDHELDAYEQYHDDGLMLMEDPDGIYYHSRAGLAPAQRQYSSDMIEAKVLHNWRQSAKSWLMRIVIPLDDNRRLECEHWMPKKSCVYSATPGILRVPRWLVGRLECEYETQIQYDVNS
jgi:hypothetical protein